MKPKNRPESEFRLIQAAKKVFSEHGYDRATTRMISEEAGINLGLITKYFGNKHNLLLAVIESEVKKVHSQPLPYPPQKTLLSECLCYAEYTFKLHLEHVDLFRIVIVQVLTDKEFAAAIHNKKFLLSRDNFMERISPYFTGENASELANDLMQAIDRVVDSMTFRQVLMAKEPQEKCLKDLTSLIVKISVSSAE